MKKLRKNKLGGLMVPTSTIGAASKNKRQPNDIGAVALRLGPEQMVLWPIDYYSRKPIESVVPFSQWYAGRADK